MKEGEAIGKLVVVVGGQYGSEGKGAIAGHLAKTEKKDLLAIRVAGPNAGHTVVDQRGKTHKYRCVPVAAAVRPDAKLALASGSEIDLGILAQEVGWVPGTKERMIVDHTATVLSQTHVDKEVEKRMVDRIGSTSKGVGAARADRIMRQAHVYGFIGGSGTNLPRWGSVAINAQHHLQMGGTVMIEGTQGFGLGLHAGYYPFCTSSDCRAIDFLSMAGISPWSKGVEELEVWVVVRTYPIRVAGNSGPLHREISWDELSDRTDGHIQPERTTVTDRIRRVGEWDRELVWRAIEANGGVGGGNVHLALTFLDYWYPQIAFKTGDDLIVGDVAETIEQYEKDLGLPFELIGTGPSTVIDRRG